jgi:hypothetical protein
VSACSHGRTKPTGGFRCHRGRWTAHVSFSRRTFLRRREALVTALMTAAAARWALESRAQRSFPLFGHQRDTRVALKSQSLKHQIIYPTQAPCHELFIGPIGKGSSGSMLLVRRVSNECPLFAHSGRPQCGGFGSLQSTLRDVPPAPRSMPAQGGLLPFRGDAGRQESCPILPFAPSPNDHSRPYRECL